MCTGGWCSGGCAHKGGVDRAGLDEEVSSVAPGPRQPDAGSRPSKSVAAVEVLQGRGFAIPTLGKVFLPRPAYSLSGEAGAAVHQKKRALREARRMQSPTRLAGRAVVSLLARACSTHMHRCRTRADQKPPTFGVRRTYILQSSFPEGMSGSVSRS